LSILLLKTVVDHLTGGGGKQEAAAGGGKETEGAGGEPVGGKRARGDAGERVGRKAPKHSSGAAMSRDETIANFQAITGIDDLNRSVEILESHNWNLETAAAVSLSQHDPYAQSASAGGASMAAGAGSAGPTRRGAGAHVRAPVDAAPPREVQNAPPRRGVLGFLSRLISGEGGEGGGRGRENDTQRFIELFNLEHGSVHPTAHVGTFREAVDVAKRDYKFLVVYLHSPHHQDTPAFLRETLCTEVASILVTS